MQSSIITGTYYLQEDSSYTDEEEKNLLDFIKVWMSEKEIRKSHKLYNLRIDKRLEEVYSKCLLKWTLKS